jgi:hypothetical protein
MKSNLSAANLRNRKNGGFTHWPLAIFAAAALFLGSGNAMAVAKAPSQTNSQTASTQKLAGQWQLNKDQSDDPRQKMQAARGDSGGAQGGGQGGGGNGNGDGRGQVGRNGGGRGQGAGMMDELQALQIDQSGSAVKVTGKSGLVLAQYPASDSSADKNSGGEGDGHRTTTSQWQDGQLTVVSQGPRGKSTRTYSLSADGKQLYVTTTMENERLKEPVTYRLVYDPAASGAGAGASQ